MPAGIRVGVDASAARSARDAHAAERDSAQHLDGGDGIALLLRNDVGVRRLLVAERNLIASGLIAIESSESLYFDANSSTDNDAVSM